MSAWSQSTFVFISTNPIHEPGGVEERWLDVMTELKSLGASVRFLCLMGSPMGERARALGVGVDPYILDKWNLWRSRSRLRKYLIRYHPVCVHSVGLEADLLVRSAARFIPEMHIATTIPNELQPTRRRHLIDRVMRRFDTRRIGFSSAVFVESEDVIPELLAIGYPSRDIVLDPDTEDLGGRRESVSRHLDTYRRFMAARPSSR